MTACQLNTIFCWLLLTLSIVSATNIRLVGGKTPYSGRVEVEHNGLWGTVCDDEFTVNSAKVVCRMLGFMDMGLAEVVSPIVYGPGSGIIMLDSLNCIGHEEDVANCSHNSWQTTDCSHKEDVGVNCHTHMRLTSGNTIHEGQVEVNISGIWEPICADNHTITEARVVCIMMGFGSNGAQLSSPRIINKPFSPISYNCKGGEKDISMCTLTNRTTCSSSSVAFVNCRTPIRLVNGTSAQSGRVEVEYRGQWGTICDDDFDDLEAKVICRMLGYSTKDAKAFGGAYYGGGIGSISIDEMRCTGNESDISKCKSSDWLSPANCHHHEDASVNCRSEVRLQDSPKPYSGRLEILNGSSWETVCSDLVDNKTAMVVCNMLGFEQGNITVFNDGRLHTGSGHMKMHGYRCTGNETDIADCQHSDYVDSCINGTSVGFNCSLTPDSLDPCLVGNHENITSMGVRHVTNKDCTLNRVTDYRLVGAWYYAGPDPILTSPPDQLCRCGANFPIWMNGTLPDPYDGIVSRDTCLKYSTNCDTHFGIQVKNCGTFYVYKLPPTHEDHTAYCFGSVPNTISTISPDCGDPNNNSNLESDVVLGKFRSIEYNTTGVDSHATVYCRQGYGIVDGTFTYEAFPLICSSGLKWHSTRTCKILSECGDPNDSRNHDASVKLGDFHNITYTTSSIDSHATVYCSQGYGVQDDSIKHDDSFILTCKDHKWHSTRTCKRFETAPMIG